MIINSYNSMFSIVIFHPICEITVQMRIGARVAVCLTNSGRKYSKVRIWKSPICGNCVRECPADGQKWKSNNSRTLHHIWIVDGWNDYSEEDIFKICNKFLILLTYFRIFFKLVTVQLIIFKKSNRHFDNSGRKHLNAVIKP